MKCIQGKGSWEVFNVPWGAESSALWKKRTCERTSTHRLSSSVISLPPRLFVWESYSVALTTMETSKKEFSELELEFWVSSKYKTVSQHAMPAHLFPSNHWTKSFLEKVHKHAHWERQIKTRMTGILLHKHQLWKVGATFIYRTVTHGYYLFCNWFLFWMGVKCFMSTNGRNIVIF